MPFPLNGLNRGVAGVLTSALLKIGAGGRPPQPAAPATSLAKLLADGLANASSVARTASKSFWKVTKKVVKMEIKINPTAPTRSAFADVRCIGTPEAKG